MYGVIIIDMFTIKSSYRGIRLAQLSQPFVKWIWLDVLERNYGSIVS